jgi:hypothetical protein
MPKGTYTPNTSLLSILKEQGKHSFRVTSIRDLYAQKYTDGRCANELRRWINGHFKTLTKHGYIEAISKTGVRTHYRVTAKISGAEQSNSESNDTYADKKINVLEALKARLRDRKLEMLSSSGETKEYEELCKLFPDMRTQLQTKFNLAKEKNIEYVGRVKALELLIAEHR